MKNQDYPSSILGSCLQPLTLPFGLRTLLRGQCAKCKSLSCVWLFATPQTIPVHGILQARILEWVAFPFSRRSAQPMDQTQVSCIAGRLFTSWATREAQEGTIETHKSIYFIYVHRKKHSGWRFQFSTFITF